MSTSFLDSLSFFDFIKQSSLANPYWNHLFVLSDLLIKNNEFENDGESIHFAIIYLLEEIKQKIKSKDLSILSQSEFENEREFYSFFSSYCFFALNSLLKFEKINLKLFLLINNKDSLIFKKISNLIVEISSLSFENLILSKDFLVPKELKKGIIEEVTQKEYPYFFSFFISFDTMVTNLKNEFLNSFFNNLNKENNNPPITKIVLDTNELTEINEPTITPPIQNKIIKINNDKVDPNKDNLGKFMTNFKFEELSKPRQQVLNNAYASLKLNLIEPAGVCKVEDCLYFIALNKDHPGINLFIRFLENQIQKLIKKYFDIFTVEKQLNDQSTLDNKTIFVNWFSFNENSPYKRLIQLNKNVLDYNVSIFSMNKNQVKDLLNIWKSGSSSKIEKDAAIMSLKKFYSIGYFIEPGEFFAFRSKYSQHLDLFDLWNLQIMNMSKEDYKYHRNEVQKLSNGHGKYFVASNSFPWCGMVVSYWFQNVLDKRRKDLGFDSNGNLNWKGTLTAQSLFSRNKKHIITDLRKIKPGDIFIQKSQHMLVVFDIMFFTKIENNIEKKYVQFYFIHGNSSGWHPFLQKYLEGVVIYGPPPDFNIYLEFDLWNKKFRAGGDVKVYEEKDVQNNYWMFNILGD